MNKLVLKILIGIPASGKSTWAKNFISKNQDWVIVSRDNFRNMLKNQSSCEPKVEKMITEMQNFCIKESLSKNLNVIVDNTNIKAKYLNKLIKDFNHISTIEFMVFDISLKKAIERDSFRIGNEKAGEDVIKEMFRKYEILLDSFDLSTRYIKNKKYIKPTFDKNKENVIICDIDGTLAHMSGKRNPFEWDKVDRDDLDEVVAERLKKHHQLNEKIIIVTGRDESCRELTEEWLKFYEIPYNEMYMRPKNDFRKDNIIKKEIFENNLKDKYNILFVYDDRNQVVSMWREMGIKVFQVEEGHF